MLELVYNCQPEAAMTTAVKAIYEGGVFRPTETVELEERTEVEVLLPTAEVAGGGPSDWQAIEELIGFIQDAPTDMAEHHDRYLYGLPRE